MSISSDSLEDIPKGHVRLVLLRESRFFLEIPLEIIGLLCCKPLKFLGFLGWCVLGVEGALNYSGQLVDLNGDIVDQGLYYYVAAKYKDEAIIDLEVIQERSSKLSNSTETHSNEFRGNLLERDFCCVFTGLNERCGQGMHIIPRRRGSEWLKFIIDTRPNHDEEDVQHLSDINDVRNGIFASSTIHTMFDRHEFVILKTPNYVLSPTDIPFHKRHTNPPEAVAYPTNARYTLQSLLIQDRCTQDSIPHVDATFKIGNTRPFPSTLLLNYYYGCAAVKWWGHNKDALTNRLHIPHPSQPVELATAPARTIHDGSIAIQNRGATDQSGSGSAGNQGRGMADSQETLDAEEIVLFLRANSAAAVERFKKKEEDRIRYMEEWRRDIPSVTSR